ncbi:hypothetical protein Scep_019734 [Stephania cephalantha]|uniref:Uncharacterized protein n=1 Tax=Stephania cephalantha TaxID=152367 RepID=A0AAP0IBQ4_9MAGN
MGLDEQFQKAKKHTLLELEEDLQGVEREFGVAERDIECNCVHLRPQNKSGKRFIRRESDWGGILDWVATQYESPVL